MPVIVTTPTTLIVQDSTARGPIGNTPNISVGTVTTGAPGSSATVSTSGNSANVLLNFTIPRGNVGETGPANPDAYNQANSAYGQANDAYAQANTARGTANDSYAQANSARNQANTAYSQANAAYNAANSISWVTAPGTSTSVGVAGQAAYESTGNLYICVAENVWSKFIGTTSW